MPFKVWFTICFTCEMLKLCLQPIDLAVYEAPDVDSKQCVPHLSRAMHEDRIGFSPFEADSWHYLNSIVADETTVVRNMTAIPLHPLLGHPLSTFIFLSNPSFVPCILISFKECPQPPEYCAKLTQRQCYAFRQARCRGVSSRMIQTIWDPCLNVQLRVWDIFWYATVP